jgi:hypothetical protein
MESTPRFLRRFMDLALRHSAQQCLILYSRGNRYAKPAQTGMV